MNLNIDKTWKRDLIHSLNLIKWRSKAHPCLPEWNCLRHGNKKPNPSCGFSVYNSLVEFRLLTRFNQSLSQPPPCWCMCLIKYLPYFMWLHRLPTLIWWKTLSSSGLRVRLWAIGVRTKWRCAWKQQYPTIINLDRLVFQGVHMGFPRCLSAYGTWFEKFYIVEISRDELLKKLF
jgi:hypothetical protein